MNGPRHERGATPNATLIQSLVLFSVFEMSSARIRRRAAVTKRRLKVLRLRKRCAYSSQALAAFSRGKQTPRFAHVSSARWVPVQFEPGGGGLSREDGEGDEIDRQARSRGNAAVSWSRRS
jgi:hypothetical protein